MGRYVFGVGLGLGILIVSLSQAQFMPIRIACIGNSITYGGLGSKSYPQQLNTMLGTEYVVKNFGISSTTMLKKGDYPYWNDKAYTDAIGFQPHIIIICLGTNDSKPWNWKYKNEFYGDYMDMVSEFRRLIPDPQIFVCFPSPVFEDGFGITNLTIRDEIIPLIDSVRKTATTQMINYYQGMLDKSSLFPDGIHPNAAGYTEMAKIAYNEVTAGPSGIIRYFQSQPDTLEKGDTSILYWHTTPGSSPTLNGISVNDKDSMQITTLHGSVYTLLTQGMVIDSQKLEITYLPPGIIKSLRLDPPMIALNSSETSILSWTTTRESMVSLNGMIVESNGSVSVSPAGTADYILQATGEISDIQKITLPVIDAGLINRSLYRPVTVSTTSYGFSGQAITDGIDSTYWQSDKKTSQWVYVDLGRVMDISKVIVHWGSVYSTSYYLQVLNEKLAATSFYTNPTGDGQIDTVTTIQATGRYVRVLSLNKNDTQAGLIIHEVELYGTTPTTGIEDAPSPASSFELFQNYPNPFCDHTRIMYSIPSSQTISMEIFDLMGRRVTKIFDRFHPAGQYQVNVSFEGISLPSGIYFYRLNTGSQSRSYQMIYLK